MNYEKFLIEADKLIKEGKNQLVAKSISTLERSKIPRIHYATLSSLAIRVHQNNFVIKLLAPLVHSETPLAVPLSPVELGSYACALALVGANEEALELFESLETEDQPDIYLQRSLALFRIWEADKAIPFLSKYIESEKTTPYRKIVGRVNRFAAYISTLDTPEEVLIEEAASLLAITKAEGHHLLHANCLELKAQFLLLRKERFDEAIDTLKEAQAIFEGKDSLYSLFVSKWLAIAELLNEGPKEHLVKNLKDIRQQALERHHWESVRECDLFLAKSTGDKELFLQLYFGTPFESYRKRMLTLVQPDYEIPRTLVRQLGEGPSELTFDLIKGQLDSDPTKKIKLGGLVHRLFVCLGQDSYKPIRIPAIGRFLFPEEYYDPQITSHKVHQIIGRLREWFEENEIPLQVQQYSGHYSLKATKPIGLRILSGSSKEPADLSPIHALEDNFGESDFSATEAASALKVSLSTVHRLLRKGVKGGEVDKIGQGKNSRYFVNCA
jgi:tetratricopeptide (TPR) repeat protein